VPLPSSCGSHRPQSTVPALSPSRSSCVRVLVRKAVQQGHLDGYGANAFAQVRQLLLGPAPWWGASRAACLPAVHRLEQGPIATSVCRSHTSPQTSRSSLGFSCRGFTSLIALGLSLGWARRGRNPPAQLCRGHRREGEPGGLWRSHRAFDEIERHLAHGSLEARFLGRLRPRRPCG